MITQTASQAAALQHVTIPCLLIMLGGIIATGSVPATFSTSSQWIGHAVTAFFGLLLLVTVILTGAIQGGRIFRKNTFQVYPLHRAAGIWFSIVVLATFFLGLLEMASHGDPVLRSGHGILGLTVTVLALIQLGPSLIIAKRSSIRTIHRIVGYLIGVVFSIQIYKGLNEAGFFL